MEEDNTSNIHRIKPKEGVCHLLDGRYDLCEGELGKGTYGAVYKAKHINNGFYYALKKMQYLDEENNLGFPITTIRQIMILQLLKHPNILNINEVVYEKSGKGKPPVIYICLDLMVCDLDKIIYNSKPRLQIYHIQKLMKNLLEGLAYLHSQNICHRDIKPKNILINQDEELKIADFGLAKKMTQLSTTRVVTLYYRAPELLLGMKNYNTKIDIWSVGCLGAELIFRQPLFSGIRNESDTIKLIFERMGTPDQCNWEQQCETHGRNYKEMKPQQSKEPSLIQYLKNNVKKDYQSQYEYMDLVQRMLRLNPSARYSAEQCLEHNFFKMTFDELKPHKDLSAILNSIRHERVNQMSSKKVKAS